MPAGPGSRSARIHTSCAVVSAPTLDRAFARWCFTVECESPRRWAAPFSDPANRTAATTPTSRSVARSADRAIRESCASEPVEGLRRLGETHRDRKVAGRAAIPLAPTNSTFLLERPKLRQFRGAGALR